MTFQVEIPATTRNAAANARRPDYVSAGTQSISVVVNGGPPQVFSIPAGGTQVSGCSTPAYMPTAAATCTWTLVVPSGPATFVVTLYSGPNATGSVLSSGSISTTIVPGKLNDVAVTFNGVPAALVLELGTSSPPTGSPLVIPVVVYTVDAAGYAIIGPGTNTSATLSDTDTSSATYLFATTSGQCGAAPGAGTKSLAVVTGSYISACLAYSGATSPPSVTLTATASGLHQATAAMSPSAPSSSSGGAVWVLTQPFLENGISMPSAEPAILLAYDENATANVAPLARISGSSTQLPALGGVDIGLATDQHGNVSVGSGNKIYTFDAGATGNVAPSAVTTFPSNLGSLSGLTIDSAGNAYFAMLVLNGSTCTLYRAPIVNGSETPTAIGDCAHPIKNMPFSDLLVGGLSFDRAGNLLVGISAEVSSPPVGIDLVVRYTPSAGTYLPSGAIKVVSAAPVPVPSLDGAGDVTTFPYTYPGTGFVDDEVRTVPSIAYLSAFGQAFGQWAPNGSLFVQEITQSGTAQLRRYASDSGTMQTIPLATISSTDLDWAIALAVGPFTQGAGTKLVVTPSSLSFNGAGSSEQATETVSETGYTGQIAQTNTCSGIATVSPASAAAPATFTVTATSAGSCTITYTDSHSDTATSNIVVTTTILTGQSTRRRQ
ncbi:MAG TPA: hypothetical protein VHZ01_03700 [Casimicrobiaceae bacterium]|nr:hypothetical protein [Casimicrobiaceae bacterium]